MMKLLKWNAVTILCKIRTTVNWFDFSHAFPQILFQHSLVFPLINVGDQNTREQ